MLVKVGTLTCNTDIDNEEFIKNASIGLITKKDLNLQDDDEFEEPLDDRETNDICQKCQALYFDSDNKNFYRGYTNIGLHYTGKRFFIKKINISKKNLDENSIIFINTKKKEEEYTISLDPYLVRIFQCYNYAE